MQMDLNMQYTNRFDKTLTG